MHSKQVWSLNHDITTSLGLGLSSIFLKSTPALHRRNSVRVHPYAHLQHIKVLKHCGGNDSNGDGANSDDNNDNDGGRNVGGDDEDDVGEDDGAVDDSDGDGGSGGGGDSDSGDDENSTGDSVGGDRQQLTK